MSHGSSRWQAVVTPGGQSSPGVAGAFAILRAALPPAPWANAATLAVAALASFAMKAFYARASADDLAFVLAPTAALVELISGVEFEAEPGVGYLSRTPAYLIAPVCAGLNFTIAAFATLVLGFSTRLESGRARAAGLVAFAAIALAATPVVNALRIGLDLGIRPSELPAWLDHAQAHRLEGVVIYLGALWILFHATQHAFALRGLRWAGVLIPVATYLGVTLLVPLLNGGGGGDAFWQHARGVLGASLALTGLGALLVLARRRSP